ncbi:MAG TPA: hypothetical protein PKH79_14360, partial [Prolixibacteraceae bacterium]|nr:hypothetical protein [Prolixibacteraceae bacterium]
NDQIKTSETVEYKGTTYQVIERIESVIIQSVLFSSDFINYFEKVNEYLENRTDPFSIMAEKIPSNLSNRIGFFGSLAITEKEIVLPTIKNGSVVIDF